MLRAVLDANVYISAVIRPSGPPGQIVGLFVRRAAFELVLSNAIAEEVIRAFKYPKLHRLFTASFEPEQWFARISLLAKFVSGEYEIEEQVSEDSDDDKYLAAAIEAQADFVVTGDSDLLDLKEYQRIRIISPRAFLSLLKR